MNDSHLSPLAVSRLATDESEGLDEANAHLDACAQCSQRVSEARDAGAQFRANPAMQAMWANIASTDVEPDEPPAKSRALHPGIWAGVAGMVAAAVVVVVMQRPGDEIRTKGSASLELYNPVTKQVIVRLKPEQPFRLRARCNARCEIRVYQQTADQAPAEIPQSKVRLKPNVVTVLPFEAQLDDTNHKETLIALFCEKPPSTEALKDPAGHQCERIDLVLRP